MGTMNTGLIPQNLRPGMRMFFGMAYPQYDVKYDKLFDVKTADSRAYEEDVMLSNLGLAAVKSQGTPVIYDSGNQLFTVRYTHIQYGLGFSITEEMLEDGVALKVGEAFSTSLKQSMLRSREIIAHNTYINAFSSSALMEGGDLVALGSNAHPTAGGNFSNVPVTPSSLSEASLEQSVIDIMKFTDNRGQLIGIKPDKIIIPIQLQFTAHRILESVLKNDSGDNATNALRDMGMFPGGVIASPWLTSTTNWFVRTDQPGLNFFNRKDIVLSDDDEFDTNNAKFKALMRFSVGWTDPRSIYCVNA